MVGKGNRLLNSVQRTIICNSIPLILLLIFVPHLHRPVVRRLFWYHLCLLLAPPLHRTDPNFCLEQHFSRLFGFGIRFLDRLIPHHFFILHFFAVLFEEGREDFRLANRILTIIFVLGFYVAFVTEFNLDCLLLLIIICQ